MDLILQVVWSTIERKKKLTVVTLFASISNCVALHCGVHSMLTHSFCTTPSPHAVRVRRA